MAQEGSSPFPTTDWGAVRKAGAAPSPEQREWLDALLRRYRPALLAHLIHKMKSSADWAEDVVQGFIHEKILERNLLGSADPARGRFRTFVLTALDRYAIDCWRKQSDGLILESFAAAGRAGGSDAFDAAWALGVLIDSVRRMRQECARKRRSELWGIFAARALAPLHGMKPLPYEELAERYRLDSNKQAAKRYQIAEAMFRRNFQAVLVEQGEEGVEEEARLFRRIFADRGAELVEQLRIQLNDAVPEVSVSTSNRIPLDCAALARLMELPRPPVDLALPLQHVLTMRVPSEAGENGEAMPESFGALLHHPQPPLTLLERVKQFAKDSRADPESPLPPEVATVLYYAAVAAALARAGRRISRHHDATLRQGFQWGCDQPWVDEATRELLREGLRAVGWSETR